MLPPNLKETICYHLPGLTKTSERAKAETTHGLRMRKNIKNIEILQ